MQRSNSRGSDEKYDGGNLNRDFATKSIGEKGRAQGTEE